MSDLQARTETTTTPGDQPGTARAHQVALHDDDTAEVCLGTTLRMVYGEVSLVYASRAHGTVRYWVDHPRHGLLELTKHQFLKIVRGGRTDGSTHPFNI